MVRKKDQARCNMLVWFYKHRHYRYMVTKKSIIKSILILRLKVFCDIKKFGGMKFYENYFFI